MASDIFHQFGRRRRSDDDSKHQRQDSFGVFGQSRAEMAALLSQTERLCAIEKRRTDAVLERLGLKVSPLHTPLTSCPPSAAPRPWRRVPCLSAAPKSNPAATPPVAPVPPPTTGIHSGFFLQPARTFSGMTKTDSTTIQGLLPYPELEEEWRRMLRDKMRRQREKEEGERLAEEEEWNLLPNGDYTQAKARPTAYIPQTGPLPLPKPYGAKAPFKPAQPGANMRYIRKPTLKPIQI